MSNLLWKESLYCLGASKCVFCWYTSLWLKVWGIAPDWASTPRCVGDNIMFHHRENEWFKTVILLNSNGGRIGACGKYVQQKTKSTLLFKWKKKTSNFLDILIPEKVIISVFGIHVVDTYVTSKWVFNNYRIAQTLECIPATATNSCVIGGGFCGSGIELRGPTRSQKWKPIYWSLWPPIVWM